jgi:hypothetical protein
MELTSSTYGVANIEHERDDSRASSTGCKMTPGRVIQGMRTSEDVCFNGETHQAHQYVIRESGPASVDARSF